MFSSSFFISLFFKLYHSRSPSFDRHRNCKNSFMIEQMACRCFLGLSF
ncbi:hypothetical protein HOLDEFILI_01207 [Holdemania filiformis DSM 12042]|uniref:Uncharacterized protein n=1 Tax=Holdemania filiformis DSM 12042 TaxID=545696 RepID=B9Y5X6_9FIRM|nr:hypothetical protein HOLDEFILI_01207 [Holdemania filiformis DSM 12042]